MAGENNQNSDNSDNNAGDASADSQSGNDQNTGDDHGDPVAKLVETRIQESLKPIKEKLDNAFRERDEAQNKVKEFEKREREANLKRLQEEGKHKEAADLQIAEERAARETAERRVVELTRDLDVKEALISLNFRSDSAREMAQREVVGQLVRDDKGNWVHRSGVSVRDFVKTFADNSDNAFLFKPKVSSGGGSSTTKNTDSSSGDSKSLFKMSQEEVLKLAEKGQLRRHK